MLQPALSTTAPVRRRQSRSITAFDANGQSIRAKRLGELWTLCERDGGYARG
jgi:hypothetical protein